MTPDPQPPRRLVTINEACALAAVSRRTIYNWMHAGKVDFVRTAGGCVRLVADSVFQRIAARADV